MKLLVLTILTMSAFASNSLLNRAALADKFIDPGSFAWIRLAAGMLTLLLLLSLREKVIPRPVPPDWAAIAGLAVYMLGFSFAYVSLDAGVGALILFSGVQITMFAGAVIGKEHTPVYRWIGAGLALVGLGVLCWPSKDVDIPVIGVALMVVAAVGWGIYSLMGRRVHDPLESTAWNFTYTLPVAVVAMLLIGDITVLTSQGVLLAIISGAVTSGMGYALWYRLMPEIGASIGALAQLSVPVIALVAGAILLGEVIPPKAYLASALILGGIAIGIMRPRSSLGPG